MITSKDKQHDRECMKTLLDFASMWGSYYNKHPREDVRLAIVSLCESADKLKAKIDTYEYL